MIIDAALKLQEQTWDKTEDHHNNNEVTEPELTNSSTNSSRDVSFNIMYRFENKIFTVDVFSSKGNSTESTQCFPEISTSNRTYDSYNTFTTCIFENKIQVARDIFLSFPFMTFIQKWWTENF